MGIEETLFGGTILTHILTCEDVLLTLEPVRRGVSETGIGHVIGSVIVSMTANVGIITFVADVVVPRDLQLLHLPAMIVVTGVAAYVISTRSVKRWHAYLLAGLCIAYWIIAFVAFDGVPVGDPL